MIGDALIEMFPGGYWGMRDCFRRSRLPPIRHWALKLCKGYLARRGSFIGANAVFEDVPVFPHGVTGVFISNGARVGAGCVIFHHVTLGSNTLGDSRSQGAPTIGKRCFIGAGAMVIGGVTVGDNVRIGANCVVVQDVPDNSVVVAAPVRVIPRLKLDNSFRAYHEVVAEG